MELNTSAEGKQPTRAPTRITEVLSLPKINREPEPGAPLGLSQPPPWCFCPFWGGCDGDSWIREVACNCRLAYKGARDIGNSAAAFYWVLVLPDSWIDSLTQALPLDVTMFPMHQLNPCFTLEVPPPR